MPVSLKSSGGGSVTMDVPSTASTFTLTLPAANGTVLQSGTAVTVAQGGTGLATLTANNVVLGNGTGTPNFVAPGTNGNVLTSNGTTWTSATPATSVINVQTFTSSGTWTKPSYAAGSRVFIQAWGGGGSGGKLTGTGGGGGGYNERWLTLSQMGATETITIGAGGAAKTTNGNGNVGGTTTAGSLVSAYGGGGGRGAGTASDTGGGGGGQLSAGATGTQPQASPGKPYIVAKYDSGIGVVYFQGSGPDNGGSNECDALYHGAGGANIQVGVAAGISVWGGGGGGASSVNTAGGASRYGGSGGAGGTSGTAGTQPAGGGGGSTSGNSGAGGDGQVIITVFPA
jgi:hypothetical protein